MTKIPYPEISGSDREQLRQIKRYLFSLADTLNINEPKKTQQLQDASQTGLTKKNVEKIVNEQLSKSASLHTVTLLESGWTGTAAPYRQNAQILNLKENSAVLLLPDSATLTALWNYGTALQIENDNSTAVVYAYGAKPKENITTQILVVQTEIGG